MIEKTKSSRRIYQCSFLEFYEDEAILSNGRVANRVTIKHVGAAAILPITKDQKIILTKQFRYPVKDIMIEIPAGKKDDLFEDTLSCAKRELEEETGYVSNHFKLMFGFHPCLGYSDEKIDIYIAYDCEKKENPKPQDIDEHVDIMLVDAKEIQQFLDSNSITDGKTIMALQYYLLNHR
jgi:ADP-ribose pyrophosphatase